MCVYVCVCVCVCACRCKMHASTAQHLHELKYVYAVPLLHVFANARSASHRPPDRQNTAFHPSVETDACLGHFPKVAKPDAHP